MVLNNTINAGYASGTWTPTLNGATPGTTTYTSQNGTYFILGNYVFVTFKVVITGSTGTGNAQIGGLPFAVNGSTFATNGSVSMNASGWAWPASHTSLSISAAPGNSFLQIVACGSSQNQTAVPMTNSANTCQGQIFYLM